MNVKITDNDNEIVCSLYIDANLISCCGLTMKEIEWTIFKWNTYNCQHSGYGKITMRSLFNYCVDNYGIPSAIKYIWNGQNDYVGEWLQKNFDAECCCPLAILKNNSDDDWESHIYQLNKDKVLKYFDIV